MEKKVTLTKAKSNTEELKQKKKIARRRSKSFRKLKFFSGLFIAPSFLGVMTFFIVPFAVIIYYSMVDNPVNAEFVGLENFKSVATNGAFVTAVKNTALFSAIAVPLAVVLSLILAIVLDLNIPFQSQFRTFFLSPMMVPVASSC